MRPEEFIKKKEEEVNAMKGRRGVGAARRKLELLKATLLRHQKQLEGELLPREPDWPDYARELIARAGWRRGPFLELQLDVPKEAQLRRHPRVRTLLDQWEAVQDVLGKAQERGLLPHPFQQWDEAGRGRGISIDVYSFAPLSSPKLVLVQVRKSERRARKHFLSVTKDYFVTDGERVVKVPAARIKRAAALDAAPDSPLRAVKSALPEEWQALLGEELRFPPPPPPQERVVYKAVQVDDDGTIRSLYDPDFTYRLGKQCSQKARPGHKGGLYAFASLEEARQFAREWPAEDTIGRLAIVRCKARGRPIEYENGKLAFSQLKPLEIVEFL